MYNYFKNNLKSKRLIDGQSNGRNLFSSFQVCWFIKLTWSKTSFRRRQNEFHRKFVRQPYEWSLQTFQMIEKIFMLRFFSSNFDNLMVNSNADMCVFTWVLLCPKHCVRLSTGCLPVGKYSSVIPIDYLIYDWLHLVSVELIICGRLSVNFIWKITTNFRMNFNCD